VKVMMKPLIEGSYSPVAETTCTSASQKLDRGLNHPLECVLLKHNKAMPDSIGI
jgi:hypothetical protein